MFARSVFHPNLPLLRFVSLTVLISAISIGFSTHVSAEVPTQPDVNGSIDDNNVDASLDDELESTESGNPPNRDKSSAPAEPPRYSYIWAPVSEFSGCGTSLGGGSWSCTPHPDSCEAGSGSTVAGTGDVLEIGAISTAPVEGVTQRGTRIDNEGGEPVDLGIRCALPGTPEYEEAPPVVIVVTQSDFARMPVDPLPAHAGPVDGWLPVNMVNVLYTEPESQLLSTELLDTPVAIRATPTSFHWDLGDGNTITTTTPGNPFPAETISATYTQEGWYDITLTTTFAGQFSVAGGPWQDIDGTIEVTSDPVPLYSKSLESRLVNGDVPVDEDEDPWIPARTPETEGPLDPRATHRTI
jgi:hypothetical protein